MHLACSFQDSNERHGGIQVVGSRWPYYAIRTKSNRELITHTSFLGKGYDSYLPTYTAARSVKKGVNLIELPLFSGYVFCRFDVNRRQPILVTPGVFQIVALNGYPTPVDEKEISDIRTIAECGLPAKPWPFLQQGRRVRIIGGPLRGMEGPVEDFKGSLRLIVGLSLLQRALSVEVDRSWVQPL